MNHTQVISQSFCLRIKCSKVLACGLPMTAMSRFGCNATHIQQVQILLALIVPVKVDMWMLGVLRSATDSPMFSPFFIT